VVCIHPAGLLVSVVLGGMWREGQRFGLLCCDMLSVCCLCTQSSRCHAVCVRLRQLEGVALRTASLSARCSSLQQHFGIEEAGEEAVPSPKV
jgi:hypothetical protein